MNYGFKYSNVIEIYKEFMYVITENINYHYLCDSLLEGETLVSVNQNEIKNSIKDKETINIKEIMDFDINILPKKYFVKEKSSYGSYYCNEINYYKHKINLYLGFYKKSNIQSTTLKV